MNRVLQGHISPETAYVVNDYPYGFRLRCKIRYWLEYKEGFGFRFCSQTTNPKLSMLFWNKPKTSTYCILAVMVQNTVNGHVTWTGCTAYDFDKLEAFEKEYGAFFDEKQKYIYAQATLAYQKYHRKENK